MQIRREYKQFNDDEFRKGRIDFIESLLKQPRIYQTDYFYKLREENARINLQRELGWWLVQEKFAWRQNPKPSLPRRLFFVSPVKQNSPRRKDFACTQSTCRLPTADSVQAVRLYSISPNITKPGKIRVLLYGGKYRTRTCGTETRSRISNPLHYHSANFPSQYGVICILSFPLRQYIFSNYRPFYQKNYPPGLPRCLTFSTLRLSPITEDIIINFKTIFYENFIIFTFGRNRIFLLKLSWHNHRPDTGSVF